MTNPLVERFLAAHPELAPDSVPAIRAAPGSLLDDAGHAVRYDPARYPWSANAVWSEHPDICRKCYEARPFPPAQAHFGWALWRKCEPGCECAHHAEEVWVG